MPKFIQQCQHNQLQEDKLFSNIELKDAADSSNSDEDAGGNVNLRGSTRIKKTLGSAEEVLITGVGNCDSFGAWISSTYALSMVLWNPGFIDNR